MFGMKTIPLTSAPDRLHCRVLTPINLAFFCHGQLRRFPEGQLNKSPRTLQTLRRGAFTLPITHKKTIWGFLNVGCEKAWPYRSAMGGFPANIYVRAFKVTDDASKFDNVKLAEHAGEVMQKNLDEMYAIIDSTENSKQE